MVEVHVEEVSGGTSTAGIPERTGGIRSGLPVSMLPVAAALRALGADCLRPVGRVGRSDVVSTMETVTEKLLTGGVGVTVDAVSAMRLTHWHLTVSHMLL